MAVPCRGPLGQSSRGLFTALLPVLLLLVPGLVQADDSTICYDDTCYWDWDIRWDRTLNYRVRYFTYNTEWDEEAESLRIIPNIFREDDPMIGEEVHYQRVHTADGYPRDIIIINDQFHGPNIQLMEGATAVVTVHNNLDEATSIHFHGMRQFMNVQTDGIPYVTQCPIGPGQTYTYKFTAIPPGTHWWHSHYEAQRLDGLFGMIIVHKEPPKYEEHLMLFNDWAHVTSSTLEVTNPYDWDWPGTGEYDAVSRYSGTEIVYGTQSENAEPNIRPLYNYPDSREDSDASDRVSSVPNPASVDPPEDEDDDDVKRGEAFSPYTPYSSEYATTFLLNGRGRSGDGVPLPLKRYYVRPGGMYRFRACHAGSTPGIKISIDQHRLRVVSVDGRNIHPVVVDAIFVAPGERYDFEVDADMPIDRYWVRVWVQPASLDDLDIGRAGIMTYVLDDDTLIDATSLPRTCTPEEPCVALNCMPNSLHKFSTTCIDLAQLRYDEIAGLSRDIYLPAADDEYLEYFLNFALLDGPTINAVKNVDPGALRQPGGSTYTPCLTSECTDKPCQCTHMIDIPVGKTIQLVLTNYDNHQGSSLSGHHSIHLHGHGFYLMHTGYPMYNKTSSDAWLANTDVDCGDVMCKNGKWRHRPEFNYDYPVLKDTIAIPTMGYQVIRFQSDNPGFWLLHCHVLGHHISGMGLIFTASSDTQTWTADQLPICGSDAFDGLASALDLLPEDILEETANVVDGEDEDTCPTADEIEMDDVMMTKTAFAFAIIACLVAGCVLASAGIYLALQNISSKSGRRLSEDGDYRPLLKNGRD